MIRRKTNEFRGTLSRSRFLCRRGSKYIKHVTNCFLRSVVTVSLCDQIDECSLLCQGQSRLKMEKYNTKAKSRKHRRKM